ncbi:MAG: DUF1501 domain-containing protein [Gemmataceae bacterium]
MLPTSKIRRRDMMKLAAAGVVGSSMSGWFKSLARAATPFKHKSCILLWMDGGPPEAFTFSPKEALGPHKAIATSVPGIQISELLPQTAKQMHHCALLRSMSSSDGVHASARYLMHTGYRQGSIAYPSLGSIISKEINPPDFVLPKYIGLPTDGPSTRNILGGGHLGARFGPMIVNDPAAGIANLKPTVDQTQLDRRAALVDGLDSDFHRQYQAAAADAHRGGYQQALKLVHSDQAVKAFKVDQETAQTRERYGNSPFGINCLVARRLVEAGVPFIEVPLGGWDFHGGAADKVKARTDVIDQPMATLLADLKERGLLDTTLVIWMGEFGRGPTSNTHYPGAWTTLLAGGGLKTGQIIGKTDAKGANVTEDKISVACYMATILKCLGIDHTKEYDIGRPIGIVDKRGTPIEKLF